MRKKINDASFEVRLNGANANIKLRDIDPVYAVTNEHSLVKDAEFLAKHKEHAGEIAILGKILGENNEQSRELSSHRKLK